MQELMGLFSELEDPRSGNARRHDFMELLFIALILCAQRRHHVWTWRCLPGCVRISQEIHQDGEWPALS